VAKRKAEDDKKAAAKKGKSGAGVFAKKR
jgi:hypothetical protein